MIVVSALLAGAVALSPVEPVEPPELLEPGGACIAQAVPTLYLGDPLRGCPQAPPGHLEPRYVPLPGQSFIDE